MNKNSTVIDFAPESVPMRRTTWLIYLSAYVILLAFVGDNALNGDEGIMAEGIRLISGGTDIFSPQCWWQPDDRSLLWFCRLRMLPALIFGSSELICRLFSILASIGVLWCTMSLTGDFFNRRSGACAAWMLIGSYGFIYWGRFAGNFMTLAFWVLFTTLCLRNACDRFWWRTVIFTLIFTGTMWWGMNYLLFLPGILLITWSDGYGVLLRKQWLFAVIAAAVIAIAAGCWLVGFAGVPWAEYPARFFRQFKASFLESCHIAIWPGTGGAGNFYRSPVNFLRLLLPWTLPALAAAAGMIRKWKDLSYDHRRLLAGTLFMLICTGIFPGRRWQYQLSLLPFFIMICAGVTAECVGVDSWSRLADRIMWWSFCVLGSLAVAVIVTWPLWQMIFGFSPPLWIMFGIPVLGLASLAFLVFDTGGGSAVERVSGMNGPWSGYILSGVCLMTACFVVGASSLDRYRSGRPFWKHCGLLVRHLPAHEVIYFGSFPDAKQLYYLELPTPCPIVSDPGELTAILPQIHSGEALLMIKRADIEAVSAALDNAGWSMEHRKPLAVEAGAINFYNDEFADDSKFIICRIRRGIDR